MRRWLAIGFLTSVGVTAAAADAAAQQQSVSFYVGGFVPHGVEARVDSTGVGGDVLVNNLDFLAFRIGDFQAWTFGGEYLVGVGRYLDAGFGVGIYQQTVPSVYADLVNEDGSEIVQDLQFRIVPWTATVRFLPLGRSSALQPYIGVGVGILQWRYRESGQFVASDQTVFTDTFVGSGTNVGPVFLGGVRFPVGSLDIGGEVRYQNAEGTLPVDQGFSAEKIDLGGWTYAATIRIKF